VSPKALREAVEKDLVPAVLSSGRWMIDPGALAEARGRLPAGFPASPGARPTDATLAELQQRLDAIERRLATLEEDDEPRAGGPSLRPALTPLFRRSGEEPGED